VDLSYRVLPSRTEAAAAAQQRGSSHFALVIRSAELDLQRRGGAEREAADLLDAAFQWPDVSGQEAPVRSARAPSLPGAADEAAAGLALRRQPLGSAQARSHRRQQAQQAQQAQHDEAEALAAEAAELEALAEGADEERGAEEEGGAGDEDAWRRYWLEHYAYHGTFPGSPAPAPPTGPPPSTAAAAAAPSTPGTPAARPPPSPAPTPPPPVPVGPPPPAWASPAGGGGGGGEGTVVVPAALLRRYHELEWLDWQRRHAEWCAAFEAWKLASPPPPR
jgi:hypothetical protein